MNTITKYGLSAMQQKESATFPNLFAGRIVAQEKGFYRVVSDSGMLWSDISGKLRFEANSPSCFPAVGDFVMLDRPTDQNGTGIIHHILKRKSLFVRKSAGNSSDGQIVAANIDTVFVCMSLNNDFNLRRLERYLALSWESGATPVIVLTKADLCEDVSRKLSAVQSVSLGVDILIASSIDEDGYQDILPYCKSGQTIALIGSSGVGKSTLVNHLIGYKKLLTKQTRNDDKGRHTTTRRELFLLENGSIIIDTPGMRELGISNLDEGLNKSFADVEKYLNQCRFRNCTHTSEPGCAIYIAIEQGELSSVRWAAYRKLKTESIFAENKEQYLREKKQKLKNISKLIRSQYKD